MVAKTVALPNVRKMFIPDPGFVICDSDLAQADAQVVAWEADDQILKDIFHDPDKDLHNENALAIFKRVTPATRQLAKGGVHATNYGASAATLARALGISRYEAQGFIDAWFTAHPGIYEWHRRIEHQLQTTRTIYNKFGFRKVFFDRVDRALPEALAWIPQSTVAITINTGMANIHENLYPDVQVLLQVHDSIVYQVRESKFLELREELKKNLEIVIPYDDPLIIPIGLAASKKSWGDVVDVPWEGATITDPDSKFFGKSVGYAIAA